MKNDNRMNTRASSVSRRGIAILLCFVMLITAIGSGSVLTAIAAGFEASDSAILADAAKLGASVADAIPTDDTSDAVSAPAADVEDTSYVLEQEDIDDGFIITKKGDTLLAETGANITLANNDYLYIENFVPTGFSDCFVTSGGVARVELFDTSAVSQGTYDFAYVSGTAGASGAIYRAQITTGGTFQQFKLYRGKYENGNFNQWNESSQLNFSDSSHNCFSGGGLSNITTKYYDPRVDCATDVSLSASTDRVYTNESVTFTASATPAEGATLEYTFKDGDATVQAKSSSNTFTTTYNSTGSHSITVVVTSGSGYKDVTSSATAFTVDDRPDFELHWGTDTGAYDLLSNTKSFKYKGSDIYKAIQSFSASTTYLYITTKDATKTSGSYYKPDGKDEKVAIDGTEECTLKEYPHNNNWSNNPYQFYSDAFDTSVSYLFTFDLSSKKVKIEPAATHTVTINQATGGTITFGDRTSSGTMYEDDYDISIAASSGYVITSYTINGVTTAVADQKNVSISDYAFTANTTITATYTAAYDVKYVKKGDGTGTVTIDSASVADDTTVYKYAGVNVTFTASADSGKKFMGWYSDASCMNLLSYASTYTVSSISANATVYAYFGFANYYLTGYLRPSHYAGAANFGSMGNGSDISTAFTASVNQNEPHIFTYSMDVRGDQLAKISTGTGKYPAKTDKQGNGAVAGNYVATFSDATGNNWSVEIPENAYRRVTYTWDAVEKSLSWTVSNMDFSNKTVVLVKSTLYSNIHAYSHTYLSSDSTKKKTIGNSYPGAQLSGNYPTVQYGGNTYYVLSFDNTSDFRNGSDEYDKLAIKPNAGDESGANIPELGNLPKGSMTVINGVDGSNPYSDFTEEDSNATWRADWIETITLDDQDSAGKAFDATLNATQEFKGSKITVTAKPKHAYNMSITVKKADGTAFETAPDVTNVTGTDNYTFTLPAEAVKVEVRYTLKPVYDIVVKSKAGGSTTVVDNGTGETAVVNAKSNMTFKVIAGDTLTLTPAARSGWRFKEVLKDTTAAGSGSTTNPFTTDAAAENATYAVTFEDAWPPAGISTSGTTTDKFKYACKASNSSSADFDDSSCIDYLTDLVHPTGYWWIDLSNHISDIKATGNGWYCSIVNSSGDIWRTAAPTIDTTNAPGVSVSSSSYNSKNFIQIQRGIADDVTKLGIKITDDGTKFTYTFYSLKGGGSSSDGITLYAKDGTIRNGYTTFAYIADTTVLDSDGISVGDPHTGNTNNNYVTYGIDKGETVTIKTKIKKDYKDDYYVRGFLVNGVVPEGTLNTSGKAGGTVDGDGIVYSLTYTCPEDFTTNIANKKVIEVTPIYYLVDTTKNKTVTFYVKDFSPELKAISDSGPNWGDTLYAYPFYSTLHAHNNAFGGYPGQPLIYYMGQYSVQIPIYDTSPFDIADNDGNLLTGADAPAKKIQRSKLRVSGITLHNGYYDTVHRDDCMGYKHTDGDGGNDQYRYQTQTYDFDDFYKIYKENDNVDNIVFQFKYKDHPSSSSNDNYSKLSGFTASTADSILDQFGKDDFEDLVNFNGRKVNIYGDAISGEALSNPPLYVVSKAGASNVQNIAGYYATEWVIYTPNADGTDYTMVSGGGKDSVPPSVLLLKGEDSFDNDTYPSAVNGKNVTDWKTYYNALASYKSNPVKITYEEAKYDVSGDRATRTDGRWLYSSIGDNITSNIKIEVNTSATGGTWVENGTTVTINDIDAYFTNSGVEGQRTFSTFIDPDKDFSFTAVTNNPDYRFEGWYLADGNLITNNLSGLSHRTDNLNLVARFRYVAVGQLKLSHIVDKTTKYQGNGSAYMSVVVSNTVDSATTIIKAFNTTENDIMLGSDIINTTNANYDIKITLSAVPSGEDKFALVSTDSAESFFGNSNNYTTMPGQFTFKVSSLFTSNEQTVKAVTYKSYFIATTYKYALKYQFTGKLTKEGGNRVTNTFNKAGTLTPAQSKEYVLVGDGGTKYVSEAFIKDFAPYEENYGEDMKWQMPSVAQRTFSYDKASNTYTLVLDGRGVPAAPIISSVGHQESDLMSVTFNLPYFYNSEGIVKRAKESDENKADATGAVTDSRYGLTQIPYRIEAKNFVVEVPYGRVARNTDGLKDGSGNSLTYDQTVYGAEHYNPDFYVTAPMELQDTVTVKTPVYKTDAAATIENLIRYDVSYTLSVSDGNPVCKTFQYWSIYSPSDAKEVARCYTNRFTFAALDNYVVTPIYKATDDVTIEDPTNTVRATLAYLGPSRNQWNNNGYDGASAITDESAQKASDLLFQDFVMSYNYKGQDLFSGYPVGVTTGYVVERIAGLDRFEGNVPNTNTGYYAAKYMSALTTDKDSIAAALFANTDATSYSGARSGAKLSSFTFDNSQLSEKDRVQCFYSVYNSRGWTGEDFTNFDNGAPETNYNYKKYIYRAFAYIKDNTGVTLSDPVYFTFYDIASK